MQLDVVLVGFLHAPTHHTHTPASLPLSCFPRFPFRNFVVVVWIFLSFYYVSSSFYLDSIPPSRPSVVGVFPFCCRLAHFVAFILYSKILRNKHECVADGALCVAEEEEDDLQK